MTMPAAVAGAISGLVATAPMTAAMLALDRALPGNDREDLPPEQITEGIAERAGIRDDLPEPATKGVTAIGHFGYGAAAGALFGVTATRLPLPRALAGVAYALAVWSVSYLGWVPAARLMPPAHQQPARRNAIMIASHVVWGASMGIALSALAPPMACNSRAGSCWFQPRRS